MCSNNKKKALITGITGQDGSYLAELLLERGHEVHGIVRRTTLEDPTKFWRIQNIESKINLHVGSMESFPAIYAILQKVKPDYCYHFAAQSFVSYSFDDEYQTMNANINGTYHLLSAIKNIVPECRFYFSGSSEIFGRAKSTPQNENTPFHPRAVYGISKMVGFELVRNYRESNNLFTCTGILYNHESPRRGNEFVTRKITLAAAKIKLGLEKELKIGNLEAKRDWGFAGDYVEAIYRMLELPSPEDFVIGTGKLHSVRQFLEIAFKELNLNYQDHVIVDEKLFRPSEEYPLMADPSKAQKLLGWKSTVDFENLVSMMVKADYNLCKKYL
ncbi:MAG: GDP-mannose 4,6-dehydratase [Oligoflexia bacterium]|nr:GDP-mannose 4,6-dehydratase [Oligoflexia bacterium]